MADSFVPPSPPESPRAAAPKAASKPKPPVGSGRVRAPKVVEGNLEQLKDEFAKQYKLTPPPPTPAAAKKKPGRPRKPKPAEVPVPKQLTVTEAADSEPEVIDEGADQKFGNLEKALLLLGIGSAAFLLTRKLMAEPAGRVHAHVPQAARAQIPSAPAVEPIDPRDNNEQ